jgi:hypothetical protein
MTDVYAWFDPYEARRVSEDCPRREREAHGRGYSAGQAELNRLLSSVAFKGFEIAAETLGRQMAYAPEVKEAITTVAAGLRRNAAFETRTFERIERMDKVVEMRVVVQPFQLNYAVVLEPDMLRRAR